MSIRMPRRDAANEFMGDDDDNQQRGEGSIWTVAALSSLYIK